MLSKRLVLLWFLPWLPLEATAAEIKVTIRADFPGGNVLVKRNEGATLHLAPDLRGGRPWFYWHFEAQASQPGRVTFVFADPPQVGARGPAVSRDGGKSWQWLGADHVEYAPPPRTGDRAARYDSFRYEFTDAAKPVRFAVAIPYLQSNLDAFLKQHAGNPHLVQGVLTKSRKGRAVELLEIGKPGPAVQAVLVTARHHACESMASYVLEGFLREAISDGPAGVAFRKKYVLWAVPFVDKDGVEEGDQGKNRHPHDHNRDYGHTHLYPEIAAIQALAESRRVRLALDLHCPLLRGDIHETFHFAGLAITHVNDNVNELSAWLKEEGPPAVAGPYSALKKPPAVPGVNNLPFSHYFAYRPEMIMAATLEVPYAQHTCPLDAAMARQYGAGLLRAWLRTDFINAAPGSSRGAAAHAGLRAFREDFQRAYRGKPQEAERSATSYLDDAAAPPLYRSEANNLMALLRFNQRRLAEAKRFCDAVISDRGATTHQHVAAVLQRLQIVSGDPKATAQDVEAGLGQFLQLAYPSPEQLVRAYEAAGDFFQRQRDYAQALRYAQRQLPVASRYEKGRTLNRMAALCDLLGQKEQAVAMRQEAVAVLREQLDPVPVGIFGPLMAFDLLEALNGIPSATAEEKKEAAAMVLNHKVAPAWLKEKARKVLADLIKD